MSPTAIDRTGSPQGIGTVSAVARVAGHDGRPAHVEPHETPGMLRTETDKGVKAEPAKVLDTGQPPVDPERVVELKRAIEKGDYPLVPARIADALIAAGMLLQKGA